ncbi:M20/M25/M40 family metallo-hydrolase [Gemmatimonadota bacterium]
MMVFRRVVLVLILLAPGVVQAQESPLARFEFARLAWDGGEFVEALELLEGLLLEPIGGEVFEKVALLTGELYSVQELAEDGRAVRWSPDGRYALFEAGTGSALVTQVVDLRGPVPGPMTTIEGSGLVMAPSGSRVAFLAVADEEGLEAARTELQETLTPTDRAGFLRFRAELARIEADHTEIVIREMETGAETRLAPEAVGVRGLIPTPPTGASEGRGIVYFVGHRLGESEATDIYRVSADGGIRRLTEGPARKENPSFAMRGRVLVYQDGPTSFAVMNISSGATRTFAGSNPVVSGDGMSVAFFSRDGEESTVSVLSLGPGAEVVEAARTPYPVGATVSRPCTTCPELSGLAVSENGRHVVFQAMPRDDWELFHAEVGGGPPSQLTREIQHDLYPRFLPDGRLLAMKGEGRHRRSHLYDVGTGNGTWLFRNNTVRTVAPEYEWAVSPDGTRILIVAERDGDTVSPERGVYLMDLTRRVSTEEVMGRIRENLASERDLKERGEAMFSAIASEVQGAVDRISTPQIFEHEEALFQFGSKYITEPGNRLALDYLAEVLRTYGYEPELQWFEPRGTRTANVVATLRGTDSPEVVYAVSAHFDSNRRSPGADDNTSGTVGLLEAARVLADHPLPATVQFAFFTGEEAGLLGSREYVRRAVESGTTLVGALNNDMVGFAEDHRLDNTIRYSNAGIRDLQHAAAIHFSDLVTHDAKYYKSTDAAAYYDAYGDIVGGIGSYPILASPHYHQVHDILETVNHQLVAEVAKVTTASVMLMASSPSRLTGLALTQSGGGVEVSWAPAVESDVTGYEVAYGTKDAPMAVSRSVSEPRIVLEDVTPGTVISVKAVNRIGMKGWDWARVVVGGD